MASSHLSNAPQPTEKQLKQTLKNTKVYLIPMCVCVCVCVNFSITIQYLHPGLTAKHITGALDNFSDLKSSVREYGE